MEYNGGFLEHHLYLTAYDHTNTKTGDCKLIENNILWSVLNSWTPAVGRMVGMKSYSLEATWEIMKQDFRQKREFVIYASSITLSGMWPKGTVCVIIIRVWGRVEWVRLGPTWMRFYFWEMSYLISLNSQQLHPSAYELLNYIITQVAVVSKEQMCRRQ